MSPTTAVAVNQTTQITDGSEQIRIAKSIFDLETKKEVEVVKIGQFAPVKTMEEFVARLGNDSSKILEVVNDGLKEFERAALINSDSPWLEVTEEGEIGEPFSGTPISTNKLDSFNRTVISMAKMMFGYPDGRLPKTATKEEREAARTKKTEARDKAIDMVLSNPAAVEALKG